MILSVNDFELGSTRNDNSHWYAPKQHIIESSYYKEVHDEFVENFFNCLDQTNWIFQVGKAEVFNELNWIESESDGSHTDNDDGSFPEFENQDQATLFLITAILLHNEKIQH